MATKRPVGRDQRYVMKMTNAEWITGAPWDARSLRAMQALEGRGLVQSRTGRWYITPAGKKELEHIDAAGVI